MCWGVNFENGFNQENWTKILAEGRAHFPSSLAGWKVGILICLSFHIIYTIFRFITKRLISLALYFFKS